MVEFLNWEDICDIAKDVDQNFRFPEANAIVPVNPHRIGAYVAGAAAGSSFTNPIDKLKTIEDNLQAAHDFLDYAPNDIAYNDRLGVLVDDTLKINAV